MRAMLHARIHAMPYYAIRASQPNAHDGSNNGKVTSLASLSSEVKGTQVQSQIHHAIVTGIVQLNTLSVCSGVRPSPPNEHICRIPKRYDAVVLRPGAAPISSPQHLIGTLGTKL